MMTIYREWGGPLNWQDETSGQLSAAVHAFYRIAGAHLTYAQFELVRAYAQYYINAPCWDMNPHHDAESRAQLASLRTQITAVKTDAQLQSWLMLCLGIGLDVL